MRVLIIGEEERQRIKEIREYAENNPFSFDDILDIKNGHEPAPGDIDKFAFRLPGGIRVVFTIDEQPLKNGAGFTKVRHISLSVPVKDKLPSPEACELILVEFGFKNKLEDCYVHLEEEGCVNIMEECI